MWGVARRAAPARGRSVDLPDAKEVSSDHAQPIPPLHRRRLRRICRVPRRGVARRRARATRRPCRRRPRVRRAGQLVRRTELPDAARRRARSRPGAARAHRGGGARPGLARLGHRGARRAAGRRAGQRRRRRARLGDRRRHPRLRPCARAARQRRARPHPPGALPRDGDPGSAPSAATTTRSDSSPRPGDSWPPPRRSAPRRWSTALPRRWRSAPPTAARRTARGSCSRHRGPTRSRSPSRWRSWTTARSRAGARCAGRRCGQPPGGARRLPRRAGDRAARGRRRAGPRGRPGRDRVRRRDAPLRRSGDAGRGTRRRGGDARSSSRTSGAASPPSTRRARRS